MKKVIITLAFFAITILAKAQVGINTTNPQGTFHIDGAKDNTATGVPTTAQQANDLIVTSAGNVGVGKINPTNKLEISSGTAGVSGLTFTNINNATSPTANAANLGVDSSGKVVVTTSNQKSIVRAQISTTNLPANGSGSSGPFTTLAFTESIDLNNNFTPSTGEFIASRDGYYNVYANLVLAQSSNWGAQSELYMDVFVNGATSIANTNVFSTTGTSEVQGPMISLGGVLKLNAGDKLTFRAWMNNANVARSIQISRTIMSIFEL